MKIDPDAIRELLEDLKSTPSEELESETMEFKGYRDEQALHNAKDLAEEISALANHRGGQIVVGVKDSSNVPAGEWAEQLVGFPGLDLDRCRERIAGRIRPAVALELSLISFEGRDYLVIGIPVSRSSLVQTSSGKVCIREGRSSRPMSPEEVSAAVKQLTSFDWSADPVEGTIEDLLDDSSLDEAGRDFSHKRALETPPSSTEYLEAIGATRNGVLTRGGLLFLGTSDAIQRRLGTYEFRFTWKLPNGQLKVNEVWSGNLWQAVVRARNLFDQVNEERRYSYDGREFSVPLMDPSAFHEGYLNALVHRDYAMDGMVTVTFTGNEMTISSPGAFYGGITSENIGVHDPRHRNKALAKILMTHALVDRAGMGVLRMSLNSLKYGRSFPAFTETADSVEVTMEARYLRPVITVLTSDNEDWGVPEMLILNSVYQTGHVDVRTIEKQLGRVRGNSWKLINSALESLPMVELCGTRAGVFIRLTSQWRKAFNVDKTFRASTASKKYVDLYDYLRRHGDASNSDLTPLLGHNHSSQTSRFLRDTAFVKREGHGPAAKWKLVPWEWNRADEG